MNKPKHLANAPIAEAVLDIRVRARRDVDPATFSGLETALQGSFPRMEEQRHSRVRVQFLPAAQEPVVEDLGVQGVFFRSEDDRTIAQFRIDGFTLNRLSPYTDWNWKMLSSTASDLWSKYVALAAPEKVVRVALRYINRIPLPLEISDLSTYMSAPPRLPDGVPQEISAFYSRVTVLAPDLDAAAQITQTLETQSDGVIWLLDIDAYRDVMWSPEDPRIWSSLNDLRSLKNRIFFNSLTDEMIRRLA